MVILFLVVFVQDFLEVGIGLVGDCLQLSITYALDCCLNDSADDVTGLADLDGYRTLDGVLGSHGVLHRLYERSREVFGCCRIVPSRLTCSKLAGLHGQEGHLLAGRPLDESPGCILAGGEGGDHKCPGGDVADRESCGAVGNDCEFNLVPYCRLGLVHCSSVLAVVVDAHGCQAFGEDVGGFAPVHAQDSGRAVLSEHFAVVAECCEGLGSVDGCSFVVSALIVGAIAAKEGHELRDGGIAGSTFDKAVELVCRVMQLCCKGFHFCKGLGGLEALGGEDIGAVVEYRPFGEEGDAVGFAVGSASCNGARHEVVDVILGGSGDEGIKLGAPAVVGEHEHFLGRAGGVDVEVLASGGELYNRLVSQYVLGIGFQFHLDAGSGGEFGKFCFDEVGPGDASCENPDGHIGFLRSLFRASCCKDYGR